MKRMMLLAVALTICTGVVRADMIPRAITGVTGTAFHEGDGADPDNGSISRIFDGAGLTVTDPFDASTWTHNASWPDNWQGQGEFVDGQTPGAWLVADLGSVRTDLTEAYIWNVREILDRGTQDVNAYVASDPTVVPVTGAPYDFSSGGWTPLGLQTLLQATAADTPADAMIDLTGIPGRYFGFEMLSNYGSTFRIGLAEVQFTAEVPEPSTLCLAAFGLLALVAVIRRR